MNSKKFDFSPSKAVSVNILLSCTGSVATIKIPLLIQKIQSLKIPIKTDTSDCINSEHIDINVRLITTENAKHFYKYNELSVILYEDKDEWSTWQQRTDPVLHIELRKWADIMIIAPLDANTLAKISSGICDNLLTCVIRAWDLKKTLMFAPAMNTFMWEHPFTSKQISLLKEFGYIEIPCIEKLLVCGDKGFGAMAEVDCIIDNIVDAIKYIKL